jgi:type VI secretion system secreted protein VgrG
MPNLQQNRDLRVKTPLPENDLLIVGLSATEENSRLFSFHLDLIAEIQTNVPFEKLIGQKITVELSQADQGTRYFSGICSRVSQGESDATFTSYSAELVPQFWLLTRRGQSRIFQHVSVPDILKKVLEGLDVDFQIEGTFHPRNFCVQYRETDFNFASRLMEEEGIFYYFKHTAGGHKMVVANTPASHPPISGQSKLIFETVAGGIRPEARIFDWQKSQELRSGKYTLWDHCFELPHKHLDAQKNTILSTEAGSVTHDLTAGPNSKLEIYDYPGEYAQRFDGVDKGGGERSGEVQKIFEDNQRTVEIRMQEEAAASLRIDGASNCNHLCPGHKFKLERHVDADGEYLLTSVSHSARVEGYRSGGGGGMTYSNSFTCLPAALPFRPARFTPKPIVPGSQTAVVVGPPGEEIFTDKYGRVKVQFHWDREGRNDPDSSCWIRVATHWAGKQWGIVHIPRIAQEVVVDFLEGDPDRPIIVGSVYNADMMPPYSLPEKKTQSGVKSRSSLGGGPSDFNEIRFEDKKGKEQLYIHAEKNEDIVVENSKTERVGNNETITIGNDRTENVGRNQTITIAKDDTETVLNNQSITIALAQDETIGTQRSTTIGVSDSLTVGATRSITVGATHARSVGASIAENAGATITITAGAAITISSAAAIAITAPVITLNGRPVLPIPKPI